MTDEITKAISTQLFLEENNSEFSNFTDLPASDLITPDEEAFKTYLEAKHLLLYDEEYGKASGLFQKAMALDDKSPQLIAYAALSARSLGDLETAKKLMSESLKHSKMLPERQQFDIKRNYWVYEDKVDNALELMTNWIKLYPSDFEPYEDLMRIYQITYQLSKAKETGLTAMKNGHKNRVLKNMVDLCIMTEDFEEAESYLEEYHSAYPELAAEDTRLSEIYVKKGDYEQAIKLYNKQLLNDPENGRLQSKLAEAHFAAGELDKSESAFEKALRYSIQAPDSASVYRSQMIQYAGLGQVSKLEATSDKWLTCLRTYMPEINVLQNSTSMLGFYAMGGAEEYIRKYYDSTLKQMPQVAGPMNCYSNFLISLFKNDAVEFRKHYKDDCKALVLQGSPNLQYIADGFLNSMEGKHEEAIKDIEIYIEKSGAGGREFGYMLSKEYRLLGKAEKGISLCEDFLRTNPHNAAFLFELALCQTASMDLDSAKATYKKLQKLWNKAEPTFSNYDEYIALGKQLGMG